VPAIFNQKNETSGQTCKMNGCGAYLLMIVIHVTTAWRQENQADSVGVTDLPT
jgi:uncharacterized membrane protein